MPSIYSVTSCEQSIASTFPAGTLTPSNALFAGPGTLSVLSVDAMSLDGSAMEDLDLGDWLTPELWDEDAREMGERA